MTSRHYGAHLECPGHHRARWARFDKLNNPGFRQGDRKPTPGAEFFQPAALPEIERENPVRKAGASALSSRLRPKCQGGKGGLYANPLNTLFWISPIHLTTPRSHPSRSPRGGPGTVLLPLEFSLFSPPGGVPFERALPAPFSAPPAGRRSGLSFRRSAAQSLVTRSAIFLPVRGLDHVSGSEALFLIAKDVGDFNRDRVSPALRTAETQSDGASPAFGAAVGRFPPARAPGPNRRTLRISGSDKRRVKTFPPSG